MEEEDTDGGIRFSSLCFVNDHVGFQGTIKTSPSDFIVTEIDEQGQLVSKAIDESVYEISETQSEPSHFVKKPKLNIQDVPSDREGNEDATNLPGHSDGDRSHPSASDKEDGVNGVTSKCEKENVDLLSSLLGEKTRTLLEQFARDIKGMWDSKTELTEPSREFSLGRIPDKNLRALLHSAVRQTFPFLITVGKNSEVFVKPNPEYKELCRLVSEEEALGFFKYLDAKKEDSKFTFKPDTNKGHRKAVHHFLNKKFGTLVETKSFPEQNPSAGNPNTAITVRFREKARTHGKRARLEREGRKAVYTAFTLQKENLEMFEAIGFLAIKLGVIPSDFSYAGLKDKKAITYQSMVVKKVTPERLKNIEKEVKKKRMNVFNIRSVGDPLRLGQLKGNHFEIVIRNLNNQINDSASLTERIVEAIENVKNKGFVNYYGPQRFGKGRKIQTDQIGLALLKNEMVKAIKLFLTPEDGDDPLNKAKRYFLQTEDAKGTLSLMPEFRVRERALLESLHRFGMTEAGCVQAWLSFPHSMRIFYAHAYSSRIWNEAASYRLEAYGTKVVAGDLICLDEDAEEHFPGSRVHLVTEEEESANTYTIHQVVLPVLGYNAQYPENKVGQWYRGVLSRDGLQACRFRVPALKLNVPGCYRHILKHPHNVSYQLVHPDSDVNVEGSHANDVTSSLSISFDLDASCYATVSLREMMKGDV
ncbi:pseudouridylate synthase PUS7L isoform X2 [Peromyscus maniculatus bairdii]|uniref:Pseudouridylate synthase PUS7L n=2 Tax=Peromyscus maniculatus bairdii TaxID=230844 RepID=A0A6J0D186_PERMB|nr:pseudouridylate synthase 7 homolog-like protein isoform X2 [Peromyscus maniculatus bairdii]XP_042120522.1 pseudouridylate synthase 7 homolog-like protein isoform X2 [Peromyscus maniculatus bairdii]